MRQCRFIFLIELFFVFSIVGCISFSPTSVPSAEIEAIGKLGFQKIKQPTGSTYYFLPSQNANDPLIIAIQGSGCSSHFSRNKEGVVFSNLPANVGIPFKGKAAILAVEKPGVSTFDKEIDNQCSEQFRKSFTFNNWINLLLEAIADVQRRYDLHPSKTIIVGHSEGSDSAAMLAHHLKQTTHVICMSGGTGSPVFQAIARSIPMAKSNDKEEDENIRKQLKIWTDAVSKNNSDALLWGHTFRYWQSKPDIAEELNASKAKILLVYGTNDLSAPAVTSDLLLADLARLNRKFEFKRIAGADHAYTVGDVHHFSEVLTDSINWALTEK